MKECGRYVVVRSFVHMPKSKNINMLNSAGYKFILAPEQRRLAP